MKTYTFSLILEGPDPSNAGIFQKLEEAGCNDALFGTRDGRPYAEFDREAKSFFSAITSGIRDIEDAVPDLTVKRVEPEALVTASEMAARMNRTRESIRLLVEGKRGPGKFPSPVMRSGQSNFWNWADVSRWFSAYEGSNTGFKHEADTVAAINGVLELRRCSSLLEHEEQAAILDWAHESASRPLQTA